MRYVCTMAVQGTIWLRLLMKVKIRSLLLIGILINGIAILRNPPFSWRPLNLQHVDGFVLYFLKD